MATGRVRAMIFLQYLLAIKLFLSRPSVMGQEDPTTAFELATQLWEARARAQPHLDTVPTAGQSAGQRVARDPGNQAAWYTEYWRKFYTPFADDPFCSRSLSPQLAPLSKRVYDALLTNYAGSWDEKVHGAGTDVYWMGNKQGACGYGDLRNKPGQPRSKSPFPYMNGAAITPSLMVALGMTGKDHGVACGACVRVTCHDSYYCPLGPDSTSAVAMVVDYCPEGGGCIGKQMDVFRATFLKATGNSSSNPKAWFERVLCPDPKTNIELRVGILKGFPQYMMVSFADVAAYGVITRVILSCCPHDMGYAYNNMHYCTGGAGAAQKTMTRNFGAWWTPANGGFSLTEKYCQFILFQEDGSKLLTRLKRPMKTTWAVTNYLKGQYVDKMDTGVQFYQVVKGYNGKNVKTKGLARRS